MDRSLSSKVFLLFFIAVMLVSCKVPNEKDVDPDYGERVYSPSFETMQGESNGFVIREITQNGYKCINVTHQSFAYTDYYALYSPHGNLILLATGPSEACAVSGWEIKYNENGEVVEFIEVTHTEDEYYQKIYDLTISSNPQLIELLLEYGDNSNYTGEKYVIERDDDGNVIKVGDFFVGSLDHKAKCFLSEWGPFWTSDLDGGYTDLFILLEDTNTEGSYVNYLYNRRGSLLAELAYWRGTLIKVRTYNDKGGMVRTYDANNCNLMVDTYYDYYEYPKWYIDK